MKRHLQVFPLCLLVAIGCSRSNPNVPASVHGKVSYNGKPLTGGTVTMYAGEGAGRYPMRIDAEGFYAGTDLPVGENLVFTVETQPPISASRAAATRYGVADGVKGGMPDTNAILRKMGRAPPVSSEDPDAGKPPQIKIPGRYADKTQSPLRHTVTKGDQRIDFELVD